MNVSDNKYRKALQTVAAYNQQYFGKEEPIWRNAQYLTHWDGQKYYLDFALTAHWEKFPRYDVIDNAIQKLGEFEHRQHPQKVNRYKDLGTMSYQCSCPECNKWLHAENKGCHFCPTCGIALIWPKNNSEYYNGHEIKLTQKGPEGNGTNSEAT